MRYSNIKLIDIEGVQYSPISIGYRCKQLNISQDCNPIELMPKSSANAVLIYQQARPDIVIERVAYHDFVYLNGTLGYKGYITINLLNGETLTNADKETISREKRRKVTNEEDLNSINDEDN